MKICASLIFVLIAHYSLTAQEEVRVQTKGVELFGTLLVPEKKTKKAILLISGSGATDRDGNTKPTYSNDALKKLVWVEVCRIPFTRKAFALNNMLTMLRFGCPF